MPLQMSLDVRKPDFCICENKDADQLRQDQPLSYLSSHLPVFYMSRDVNKPVFGVSYQVRHKPDCAVTKDG